MRLQTENLLRECNIILSHWLVTIESKKILILPVFLRKCAADKSDYIILRLAE